MPYNLLTLFKYLYISIDGSIFFNLYYLYCLSIFQRTCRFRFKSGCKGKRFIFNCQTFQKVFFSFFLFNPFLRLSMRKGKKYWTRKRVNRTTCESDCKDKDFYLYPPNFSGSFLFLFLGASALSTVSHFFKALLSWKAGAKVAAFTLRSKYITDFFSFIFGGVW